MRAGGFACRGESRGTLHCVAAFIVAWRAALARDAQKTSTSALLRTDTAVLRPVSASSSGWCLGRHPALQRQRRVGKVA